VFLELLDVLLDVGTGGPVSDDKPHVSVDNLAGAYFHHLLSVSLLHVVRERLFCGEGTAVLSFKAGCVGSYTIQLQSTLS